MNTSFMHQSKLLCYLKMETRIKGRSISYVVDCVHNKTPCYPTIWGHFYDAQQTIHQLIITSHVLCCLDRQIFIRNI